MVWILTNDILQNFKKYCGKPVVLGNKYSMIGTEETVSVVDSRFRLLDIVECVKTKTSTNILINATEEEFKNLELKCRVETMSMEDNVLLTLTYYIISGILPSGEIKSFSVELEERNSH